ncbi:MAG: hypothetical protein MR471_07380 [Clostridia bacterium]|nr:hypothetical protein [Clostridia bacterium]MDY3784578.1 hypothetical protein [Eubacteriales bacterium]
MSDNRLSYGTSNNCQRESVVIETNRVLDSCRDRDCFENARVYLTDIGNDIIDRVGAVRVKKSCISQAHIAIDPVQFNRGFYTVDIRFYVKLDLEVCTCPGRPQEFEGVAVLDKRVVLFGGESNTKIFKSTSDSTEFCSVAEDVDCMNTSPTVTVETVDPIVLGTKIIEKQNDPCCCCCCDIPEAITSSLGGTFSDNHGNSTPRYLAVSLGLFSVVRMTRPAQFLINAVEYNVPDKECVAGVENDPCSIFRSMSFPISEFSAPSFTPSPTQQHNGEKGRCGCQGS